MGFKMAATGPPDDPGCNDNQKNGVDALKGDDRRLMGQFGSERRRKKTEEGNPDERRDIEIA